MTGIGDELAVGGKVEGNLHALAVGSVIDDAGVVDLSAALCPGTCLHAEEVLQGLPVVDAIDQVCEVVAEFHGLCVQVAVGPFTQHRDGWVGVVGIDGHTLAEAGIVEMAQPRLFFRSGGIEVLGNTYIKRNLRAMVVVHLHLQCAQRTVVAARRVVLGSPVAGGRFCGTRLSVGTVDETFVHPARSP